MQQLHAELDTRGLKFHPPVYLTDQWGCPSGVPIIGVPFYLADRRLARLEEEYAVEVEGERDSMKFMRHEAGHAFHAFASHSQPFVWQRHPGAEAAELASMSMELLSGPHLGPPAGMLDQRDAAIARLEHLEDILASLAHIAAVGAVGDGSRLVATNGARFATPAARPLFDVLTCIRHRTTLAAAGRQNVETLRTVQP